MVRRGCTSIPWHAECSMRPSRRFSDDPRRIRFAWAVPRSHGPDLDTTFQAVGRRVVGEVFSRVVERPFR